MNIKKPIIHFHSYKHDLLLCLTLVYVFCAGFKHCFIVMFHSQFLMFSANAFLSTVALLFIFSVIFLWTFSKVHLVFRYISFNFQQLFIWVSVIFRLMFNGLSFNSFIILGYLMLYIFFLCYFWAVLIVFCVQFNRIVYPHIGLLLSTGT